MAHFTTIILSFCLLIQLFWSLRMVLVYYYLPYWDNCNYPKSFRSSLGFFKVFATFLPVLSYMKLAFAFILRLLLLMIPLIFGDFIVHCQDLVLLSAPFYVSNDKYKHIYRDVILIAPVMLFASISIYSPTFMFFFMIVFVSLVCFVNFSYFIKKYLSQYDAYLIFMLNFAYNYGILTFLGRLHVFIFYSGNKNFYISAFMIHLMSFFYVILTRYYFYNFILLKKSPLIGVNYYLFLVASFICLVAVYTRFLVTLSIICMNQLEILLPDLLPEVLKVEPILPPDDQSQPQVTSRSLLHVSYNNHNHNHNHPYKPRMSSWGKFGIGLGVCTLCVGSYTAYNSYLTAQAAIIQAQASAIQAQASLSQLSELQRQNDLQERAQGLISSEEYAKKWKK
jgi:hypothetical protein